MSQLGLVPLRTAEVFEYKTYLTQIRDSTLSNPLKLFIQSVSMKKWAGRFSPALRYSKKLPTTALLSQLRHSINNRECQLKHVLGQRPSSRVFCNAPNYDTSATTRTPRQQKRSVHWKMCWAEGPAFHYSTRPPTIAFL